jgi:hypothetical protein
MTLYYGIKVISNQKSGLRRMHSDNVDISSPIHDADYQGEGVQSAQEGQFDHLPGNIASEAEMEYLGETTSEIVGSALTIGPANATRGQLVQAVSKSIPHNEFGLPIFFYRSDYLHSSTNAYTQDDLNAAAVGLFYPDGYPTLESGHSFWSQLPHEPFPAYAAFKAYLDQAEELGIRQLDLLALSEGCEMATLQENYLEFYWSARARAYDLFQTAAEQRKRQLRIRKMENSHYDKAGAILAKLLEKFDQEDWIEEMSAKEAIDALETLVKVQRLSTGLTGQHASSNTRDAAPVGASAELTIRQLVRGAGVSERAADDFGSKLASLLTNEDDAMKIQELVLKVNTTDKQMMTHAGAHFMDD